MNTKHTPGPWHIGMRPGPIVYRPSGEQVTDMRGGVLELDEHRANARLIASAPELLQILQAFANNVSDEVDDYPHYEAYKKAKRLEEQARQVIAKATGE